jgi:hypothetical protein
MMTLWLAPLSLRRVTSWKFYFPYGFNKIDLTPSLAVNSGNSSITVLGPSMARCNIKGKFSHQENLKFLNRTWGALNRVLRTFQGRFFQGESRQVVSLILCLVHLENFLMLLIVCIWLMCSLLILAYLGVLKECLYICAHLKMGLGLT